MSRNKVKLKPPIVVEDQNKYKSEKSSTLILILTGVVICLIIVIILLIALPSPTGHVKLSQHNDDRIEKVVKNDQENTPVKKDIEKKSAPISTNSETHDEAKDDNKKAFDQTIELDWMLKKSDAENSKLSIWSQKNYLSAIEAADKAEQFKNNEQFEDAEKHYKRAISIIDSALKTKNEKFNLFLSNALEALEKEQIAEAGEWFKKAQAIEAENSAVLNGLYQIERREEVRNNYNLAVKFEQENEFKKALSLLDNILKIDPNYKKAKQK
ncbi:MAG: hypothetical protein KAI79_11685, partial [Bacteroidales bacterium]|nr:hypothetical protein [Bacteroidales bacterium]